MRSGNRRSPSSRRVSKETGTAPSRPRYWPVLAAPTTSFLLLFFVLPFYVVLAVTFGSVDPILRQPVLAWNPSTWDPAIMSFTLSNIVHSDGLYEAAFVHTFVFVGAAAVLCLLIGYPVAYFLARRSGRHKTAFLALFFAPFWISYMLRLLAWRSLLADDGYVNRVLIRVHLIGEPYPWLQGKPLTLVLGLVYGYVPFMILPLYATLDRIPGSLLEAILAGFVICILPMFGDYFTQQLLADRTNTRMVGNAVVDALTQPIFVARGAALILVMLVVLIPPILYYLRSTRRATELAR
jgi:ABC-type spermidine/putrescine transport system permease subunit I